MPNTTKNPPLPVLAPAGILLASPTERVKTFSMNFHRSFPALHTVLEARSRKPIRSKEEPGVKMPAGIAISTFLQELSVLTKNAPPHKMMIICAGSRSSKNFTVIFSSDSKLPSAKIGFLSNSTTSSRSLEDVVLLKVPRPGTIVLNLGD